MYFFRVYPNERVMQLYGYIQSHGSIQPPKFILVLFNLNCIVPAGQLIKQNIKVSWYQ